MDILITGAAGLIGTALRAALLDEGHRVVALVRRAPRGGADEIRWDPDQGLIDVSEIEGFDGVVHLAGAGIGDHRWTAGYKREVLDSRVKGTTLLARTLTNLDRPPSVLVSGSAIGFYGDRGDDLLTERSGPGDLFLSKVCMAWEAASQAASDAGIRVPIIRTGIVLDADRGALPKLLPLFKLYLGGKMGSGRQWWSWISLADEVRAIRFLLDPDNDVDGPVNLTAPGTVTNGEFTTALGRALGRPTFVPVPSFGPKLLKGPELAQELLFASQRVAPAVLHANGFEFEHPELDTALRATLGP